MSADQLTASAGGLANSADTSYADQVRAASYAWLADRGHGPAAGCTPVELAALLDGAKARAQARADHDWSDVDPARRAAHQRLVRGSRYSRGRQPARRDDQSRELRSRRRTVNSSTGELRYGARVVPAPLPSQGSAGPTGPDGRAAAARDFANNLVAPDLARLTQLRDDRLAALSLQWAGSAVPRVTRCLRTPSGQTVTVGGDSSGKLHVGGVQTCGSLWACPMCASREWARRAGELERGLNSWEATGGRVMFVTLTMRHRAGQSLETLWNALGRAWTAATNNTASRAALAANGVQGWVRVIEVTVGANGWHIHVHALLLIDQEDPRADDISAAMRTGWKSGLRLRGLSADDQHGFHSHLLRKREGAAEVGKYLAKGYFPAKEMTGNQHKKAGRGNLTHFGLLAAMAAGESTRGWGYRSSATGERVELTLPALWNEFEVASHNRRAMTFSQGRGERPGARELMGLREDGLWGEEEEAEPVSWAYQLAASDWKRLCALDSGRVLKRLLAVMHLASEEARQAALDALLDPVNVLYVPSRT